MRAEQPAAPPVPPADAEASMRAQIERSIVDANEAVQRAGEAAERTRRGTDGNVSVLKDAHGRIVVNTRDGRTIVIDPSVVPGDGAQQALISQAIAPPPPDFSREPSVPPQVIPLVAMILLSVLLLVLGLPLVRTFVRRSERRYAAAAPAALPAELGSRLERIEQAVESVAIEVERIGEAQRFEARLLSERLEPAPLAMPVGENANAR